MAYLDNNAVLSDAQAVTSTAASTKSYDAATALRNIGSGNEIDLVITTTTTCTAAGAATVTFALQDSADNSSFTDVVVTPAIAKATLVAGYEALRITLPRTLQRYIQVNYTVATGPLTAGAFTAYLTEDRQDNVARPSGFTV
jgi:hypothetical protein